MGERKRVGKRENVLFWGVLEGRAMLVEYNDTDRESQKEIEDELTEQ